MAIKIDGDVVTMSLEEYNEFLRTEVWENALRSAGVDNWDGYDWAMEDYRQYLKDEGLCDDD